MIDALTAPIVVGEDRLHLSGSVGIAIAPDHATGVGDLLKRADIAMYAAKNGPEPAVVYRPDIDVNDPVAALADGRAARGPHQRPHRHRGRAGHRPASADGWSPPRRSSAGTTRPAARCGPDAFLPLAERNGLIVPLTELVLDRAVARVRATGATAGRQIGISVNLSARSLLDRTLPGTVAEVLRRHRLPAHLLTLEITESIVISDADRALGLLAELRALGVRLVAGRLRHRLLVADVPERAADPAAEDRPVVRHAHRRLQPGRGDRHVADRPRPPPRPAGDRRGRRGAAGGRPAAAARLRVRPGLPVRDVDGPGPCSPSGTFSRSRDDVRPGMCEPSGRSSARC